MLCGDMLFSGHSLMMTISALTIAYYSPDRFKRLKHLPKLFMLVGMFCVSISHTHYFVDIIFAYWSCVFVFRRVGEFVFVS